MSITRWSAPSLALLLVPAALSAQAKVNQYGYPEKHAPQPTAAAISVADLMTRLYIFADDSMMGRQVGRPGNMQGTNYIAGELQRLGIKAAGENGSYFQVLPYMQRKFTAQSAMTVGGQMLRFGVDFAPVPGARAPKAIDNAAVIYGGVAGDTTQQISAAQAAGKVVVLAAARPLAASPIGGGPGGGGAGGRGGFGGGAAGGNARFAGAVAVITADLDPLSPAARAMINEPPAAYSAADAKTTVVAGDVIVNTKGQRFINEDCYHGRVSRCAVDQPDGKVYLLLDNAHFIQPMDFARMSIAGTGETWDEVEAELEMPAGTLSATMAVYNEHARQGRDPLFEKRTPILVPLDQGPFVALELDFHASYFSFFTLGGLKTSADAEVLDRAGTAIPGLFAAGRCTSGLPAWGHGYSSGLSLADCTFFGRQAGRKAALG